MSIEKSWEIMKSLAGNRFNGTKFQSMHHSLFTHRQKKRFVAEKSGQEFAFRRKIAPCILHWRRCSFFKLTKITRINALNVRSRKKSIVSVWESSSEKWPLQLSVACLAFVHCVETHHNHWMLPTSTINNKRIMNMRSARVGMPTNFSAEMMAIKKLISCARDTWIWYLAADSRLRLSETMKRRMRQVHTKPNK